MTARRCCRTSWSTTTRSRWALLKGRVRRQHRAQTKLCLHQRRAEGGRVGEPLFPLSVYALSCSPLFSLRLYAPEQARTHPGGCSASRPAPAPPRWPTTACSSTCTTTRLPTTAWVWTPCSASAPPTASTAGAPGRAGRRPAGSWLAGWLAAAGRRQGAGGGQCGGLLGGPGVRPWAGLVRAAQALALSARGRLQQSPAPPPTGTQIHTNSPSPAWPLQGLGGRVLIGRPLQPHPGAAEAVRARPRGGQRRRLFLLHYLQLLLDLL